MYNCITYLTQNKNRGTGFMWRFPKTELPPSHRQFLFGIFHETNHAAVGYLHDYGNHHLLREPPRPSDAKRPISRHCFQFMRHHFGRRDERTRFTHHHCLSCWAAAGCLVDFQWDFIYALHGVLCDYVMI